MPLKFSTKTADPSTLKTECLVVPVIGKQPLTKAIGGNSAKIRSALDEFVSMSDFKTEPGSTLLIPHPPGLEAKRLLLVRQPAKAMDDSVQRDYCAKLAATLTGMSIKSAAIFLPVSQSADDFQLAETLARTLETASYRFTAFKSKKPKAASLTGVAFVTEDKAQASAVREGYSVGAATGHGMNFARDLGNMPGNECTPSYLAERAKILAAECDHLKTTILSEAQMKKLGMGSLLSVSAGSVEEAKLIVMEYRNGPKGEAPFALVGKGITFDSGGISLKPGAAMDEMKFDMCGAASVFGTLQSVIEMGLQINLVCVIAAAENMPSGIATKPGDIVKTMAGLTVEVLNTDAEGRLVLCDALTYVAKYKPSTIIDIATLTGACVVALGKHASGLYANDDALAEQLLEAGESTGDRAWRMPLWKEYEKQLESPFADLANIGGSPGGSITAACFLAHFTRKQRWAHLDIAGTAWLSGSNKGATGRPVPLLVNYLRRKPE